MEKKMNKACCVIVAGALCISGCSAIELRSPIVIHSGQKSASETSAAQAQAAAAIAEPSSAPEAKGESVSPASIRVLAKQDLSQGRYSSLGRITVTSSDKNGFSAEQAERGLKITAYKRYGALAHGISNIEYQEQPGLFGAGKNIYREASAEVMTLATAEEAAQAAEQASAGAGGAIPSLDKIAVVSTDELFNRNFKVLGKVTVRDATTEGMSQEQAIKSLKIEAYRLFGSRVKGLTGLKLKKDYPIYFYKKPQYSPPPQAPKGYNKATAEVLYWP
jgi:hypothetical protein